MIAKIIPAHKRTEERVPVWGSELTTKAAKVRGVSGNRAYSERRILGFGD